jgi:hypothetical protein
MVQNLMAEGRTIDPDQQLRPQRQRKPAQRGGRHRRVASDVVSDGVAGPQQHGHALAGVGHPRPQPMMRVVAGDQRDGAEPPGLGVTVRPLGQRLVVHELFAFLR